MSTYSREGGSAQPEVAAWTVYHPFSFLDYAVWNGRVVLYFDQLGRLQRLSTAGERLPSMLFEQLHDFVESVRAQEKFSRTRTHSLGKAAMCEKIARALNAGFVYQP
jgi:hypothetical protein